MTYAPTTKFKWAASILATAGLLFFGQGCSDDTDNKDCVPACGAGQTCFHGICINQDSGTKDGSQPDMKKKPDMAQPDSKRPDMKKPDSMVLDKMLPDLPVPDMMLPDLPVPDMMLPDLPVPDLPVPDMMQPDMMQSDLPITDWLVWTDWTPVAADMPVATGCAAVLGKTCTKSGSQCGASGTCLLTSSNGLDGVCTCTCTPDNLYTPLVNEDTCPGATTTRTSVCGSISLTGGTKTNFCFKTCSPKIGSNDCASPIYCHPRSGAAVGQYSLAVCLYSGGCTKNTDCMVTNGKACDTVSNKCTGTGETCQALTTNGTAGMCTVAGVCDTTSGLCNKHSLGKATAKVGDPCKSDLDCGNTMTCFVEFDESKHLAKASQVCKSGSDCCSGTCTGGFCATGAPCRKRNRNGYCSISGCSFAKTFTIAACDSGSVCNSLYSGGICQKSCKLKSTTGCRGYSSTSGSVVDYLGDYECRAWNNLSIGGTAIVPNPVCDFGYTMPCDMLSGSSLDCSSVGLTSNPTNMGCRGTDNKVKTSKWDPTGLCLDNTACGTVKP